MNKVRIAISALALSAAGFVAVVVPEGYTDKAVIPTKGDKPTHGFGTTEGVRMGDTTTPVKAIQRALQDANKYEGAIKQCVRVPLHQVEYDLYVRFAYNIGPTAFCNSTVVRRLNAHDYAGACEAILLFKKAAGYDCSTPGNKRCYGLWVDRLKTHKTCMEAQ